MFAAWRLRDFALELLLFMSEHFISRQDAHGDLLACAAYIAESINGGEAKAAAIASVVPAYLERGNVDLAAELANSVDDPFTRDRLLIAVAAKCADLDDDEYALQLADAIEEPGFQAQAFERIGIVKANAGKLEKAREVAALMSHPDSVLASVAVKQAEAGDVAEAFKTIDEIEYAGAAVSALNAIAARKIKDENLDSLGVILDRSVRGASDIEHVEERIGALIAIGNIFTASGDNRRAVETLEKARVEAETLDNTHRDSLLGQVSLGFLYAGNMELADSTLDSVSDKTQIATVLYGFARDYWRKEEKDDAFEALEEAFAILKSQRDIETRDSKARFSLMGQIAAQFAGFEKGERALEIAESLEDDAQRTSALSQIACISETQNNIEISQHALASLNEDADRAFTLIGMSDAALDNGDNERAAELIGDAIAMIESIPQPSLKASASTEVFPRLIKLSEPQKARNAFNSALSAIADIRDDSKRAATLATLNSAIEGSEFRISDDEIVKLRELLSAQTV